MIVSFIEIITPYPINKNGIRQQTINKINDGEMKNKKKNSHGKIDNDVSEIIEFLNNDKIQFSQDFDISIRISCK